MSLPDLLPSIPPSLSVQLRARTNELRSRLIRANSNAQFAQTAPVLADFRQAILGLVDGADDEALAEVFRNTVPLTAYDAYEPFVARLLEKPCKASAIVDLLAPGLPDYVIQSSATSGGRPKVLPQYNCNARIKSSDTGSWSLPDPLRRRTKAYMFYIGLESMDVVDEHDSVVKTVHLSFGSGVGQRTRKHFDPEKDAEKFGTCILDHAAPFAATVIWPWRSFLVVHALFALASRSLECFDMVFISTFVDMMRCLDVEFDMVVDCIANGTIPDLDGIADVRHHLEVNISSDPERAAELRRLGPPSLQQGWCGRVWPKLRSITATASGAFASFVPMTRWFLGPDTDILSHGYGSTEAYIGPPYDPGELNQYKPVSNVVFEFLDVSKIDTISSIAQPWEVEKGKRYELVLTTEDGLWRYRLGDAIEIAGFDPTDGTPIIEFVERRNTGLRFPQIMVTEKELQATVSSMGINIVNWTVALDDRCLPATIGFFIEFFEDQGSNPSDLTLTAECALDCLSSMHSNIEWGVARGLIGKPTIRLVRPGTFCDFLQLKLDEGSNNVGQIKVPVVLPKAAYVTWFSDRVVQEL